MSDYSALTDAAINRRVAERRGWHDFEMSSYWLDDYDGVTEVECEFGTSPGGDYRPLPDVASDNNAAAALDFDAKHWLDIKRYSHGTYAEVHSESSGLIADTFDVIEARARCIAWLMYMDVTKP